jgi:hypothetical protein
MYSPSLLKEGFVSIVGILDSNYPQIPLVQAPLSISLTGINVQDKHPLVTLENIWYAAPDFDSNNWNLWVSLSDYVVGNQVSYNSMIWVCIHDISGSSTTPEDDATNWEQYFPFQVWLQQKYNQSITNLFAEVVKRKKLHSLGKSLLDRVQLYRGSGSKYNEIIGDGSLVGFQIAIQSAEGLQCLIDSVGIQLSESQENLDLYLYNSSQEGAVGVWKLDPIAGYTFSWDELKDEDGELNCILKYRQYDSSSLYYICYYQNDLLGNALSKDWDCQTPCYGCTGNDVQLFNLWSQYTTFRNIKVPPAGLREDRTLFDTKKIIYNTNTNWGLNFSMTVKCDITETILYMKNQFADAFAYQLAKEFLSSIAKNPRLNPYNDKIQSMAEADLDPKYPGNWYSKEYEDAIESVEVDLSGFNKACLPCNSDKKKIRWGTV